MDVLVWVKFLKKSFVVEGLGRRCGSFFNGAGFNYYLGKVDEVVDSNVVILKLLLNGSALRREDALAKWVTIV